LPIIVTLPENVITPLPLLYMLLVIYTPKAFASLGFTILPSVLVYQISLLGCVGVGGTGGTTVSSKLNITSSTNESYGLARRFETSLNSAVVENTLM